MNGPDGCTVALTRGLSAAVQPLLDPDAPVGDPAAADCAMFYSITNCQRGLRGVSFGNLLIKQAVEELDREVPRVKTFATISPGLERAQLVHVLATIDPPRWYDDAARCAAIERDLTALCAHYLLHARNATEPAGLRRQPRVRHLEPAGHPRSRRGGRHRRAQFGIRGGTGR
jgi:malonyl-CoA decarboxylase